MKFFLNLIERIHLENNIFQKQDIQSTEGKTQPAE